MLRRFALLLTLTSFGHSAHAQASITARTAAEARALEFVAHINAGDRATLEAFVARTHAPGPLPPSAAVDYLLRLRDQSRGFDVRAVQESTPTSATLLLKNHLTEGWVALVVRVDTTAEHRIVQAYRGTPVPPKGETAPAPRTDAERVARLRAFLDRLAAADVFSGTVLLARNGQALFESAYGEANKDFGIPNRPDTRYTMGSMTKMFTAVAIAQLAEQGKLSFEDSLARFVADFPDSASARRIRIKHLLSHTSGLGAYFFHPRWNQERISRFQSIDQRLDLARGEVPAFEPGTDWRYSNTAYVVLGKIVEIVSGQPYDAYVRDHIFAPAGMTDTDAGAAGGVNARLATGYDKAFTANGVAYRTNTAELASAGPDGGYLTTAADMVRFAEALRQGRLVNAATRALLFTPKPELHAPDNGYGFFVDAVQGSLGHTGVYPGVSTSMDLYPSRGYSVVILSNYGGAAQPVIQKVNELLRGEGPP